MGIPKSKKEDGGATEVKVEAVEGVVGFFDILGFQNYLKNDPNIASKQALEVILKIKTEVPGKIKKKFSDKILDEVIWNVLSDTIVLSVPYGTSEGEKTNLGEGADKLLRWYAIIFSSIALMDHMFDNGLPLRGAISYGKYFIHENSLAGKSIINAFQLCQRLDLAGVGISPESEQEFRNLVKPEILSGVGNQIVFPYLAPQKGEVQRLLMLNQWALDDKHDKDDIRQLVAQTFWKHDKDIDVGVYQKLENTEMLLRYVVAMKRMWR